MVSHSARVCGLKQAAKKSGASAETVTLRASVWIETHVIDKYWNLGEVTLRASVWIETKERSRSTPAAKVTLRASVWIETQLTR